MHELRTTPFKDKNGNVVGALELEIPVTERKMNEKKLSDQASILNSVLTSTNASDAGRCKLPIYLIQ